jgi:glycosyltransferase involved in cell wall biosynthesis
MAVAGDAADVVRSAGAGLACPPGDPAAMAASIRALRALPDDEREAMGRRGREYYLQQMSLTVGGQRMEEIFTRVARRAAST